MGPYTVRNGQTVYVNDSELFSATVQNKQLNNYKFPVDRVQDVQLRIFLENADPLLLIQPGSSFELTTVAYTSVFGGDPMPSKPASDNSIPFTHGGGNRLIWRPANALGCDSYESDDVIKHSVILVHRGGCTFIEKLVNAATAGASAVLVISDIDGPLNPSAEYEEIDTFGQWLEQFVLLVIPKSSGEEVLRLLEEAEMHSFTNVMVVAEPEGHAAVTETGSDQSQNKMRERDSEEARNQEKILYINGHPLMNTRLLL